jgi:Calx-beta domain-containing protein
VRIAPDAGMAEEVEVFGVEISDAQGGAGLGTLSASVEIGADGSPGGLFAVDSGGWFDESSGTLGISVERRYYTEGAVSVTVVPHSGTATAGEDFAADPVTLTWADGESGAKIANFAITDDPDEEPDEDFSFELSDATGGAVIGPNSATSWRIAANDAPQPEPGPQPTSGGGGGGRIGWLSLLLIGLARLRRSVLRTSD